MSHEAGVTDHDNGTDDDAHHDDDDHDNRSKRHPIRRILWRDITFVIAALVVTGFTSYIEMNSHNASLRGKNGAADGSTGIVDSGFVATTGLHAWLQQNQSYNDTFALTNTLLCVLLPFLYLAYVTLWIGDYDLSFRYLSTQLLRSVCGWATYLPSSDAYLMSWNDLPHVWQRKLKDEEAIIDSKEPFVSFFSGHVATMIICANHMYLHGHQRLGILFHVLNALQIIRLLATRGHYSIDIIIAWYVASHISRSAGRLGWYYSRGKTITDWLPNSPRQIFERLAGIEGERRSLRYYRLVEQIQVQEALMDMEELDYMHSESEIMQTAVRLAAESAGSLLHGGNHHSSADVQVSASALEKKAN